MRHQFKSFSIWRGRLPHWRADDVTYYVTFRHRRALDDAERALLLKQLMRPDARQWILVIACVLPEATELIFVVRHKISGEIYELSDILEKAKAKTGREIIRNTGERYSPFYTESYDRIIRDPAELEDRWTAILESPVTAELVEDPEAWDALYVAAGSLDTPMPGDQ